MCEKSAFRKKLRISRKRLMSVEHRPAPPEQPSFAGFVPRPWKKPLRGFLTIL
jgi:hypothetical protein